MKPKIKTTDADLLVLLDDCINDSESMEYRPIEGGAWRRKSTEGVDTLRFEYRLVALRRLNAIYCNGKVTDVELRNRDDFNIIESVSILTFKAIWNRLLALDPTDFSMLAGYALSANKAKTKFSVGCQNFTRKEVETFMKENDIK